MLKLLASTMEACTVQWGGGRNAWYATPDLSTKVTELLEKKQGE